MLHSSHIASQIKTIAQGERPLKTSDQSGKKPDVKKHMTVRIPRGISDAIEDFLKTDQARRMGFDSKADVVTTAVRGLLTDYGYYGSKEYDAKQKIKEKQKESINLSPE